MNLRTPGPADWRDEAADEAEEPPFKSLSAEEAAELKARLPQVSPWRVVAAQAVAGLLVTLVCALLYGRGGVVWSALYGASAVVLPTALLARGMARLTGAAGAGAAAFRFMLWEFVKIAVSVLMLVAATAVVPDLSWPALLVAMIVCLKVNWLALLWRGRVKTGS